MRAALSLFGLLGLSALSFGVLCASAAYLGWRERKRPSYEPGWVAYCVVSVAVMAVVCLPGIALMAVLETAGAGEDLAASVAVGLWGFALWRLEAPALRLLDRLGR